MLGCAVSGRRAFLSVLVGLAALPFARLARAAPAVTQMWIWTPDGVCRMFIDPSMPLGTIRFTDNDGWFPSEREAREWHRFMEELWEKRGLLPVAA